MACSVVDLCYITNFVLGMNVYKSCIAKIIEGGLMSIRRRYLKKSKIIECFVHRVSQCIFVNIVCVSPSPVLLSCDNEK
jgi:hypothetical protein